MSEKPETAPIGAFVASPYELDGGHFVAVEESIQDQKARARRESRRVARHREASAYRESLLRRLQTVRQDLQREIERAEEERQRERELANLVQNRQPGEPPRPFNEAAALEGLHHREVESEDDLVKRVTGG